MPLMESGIVGCGIRNPQTWNPESREWNPESRTLLDYLTWGEVVLVWFYADRQKTLEISRYNDCGISPILPAPVTGVAFNIG